MTENLQKRSSILLLLILFNLGFYSQDCGFFCTDAQQSAYTDNGQELVKTSVNKKIVFRFSNKLQGRLHFVDVTNMLRPILFYKESQKLIITDNTLSEQNKKVVALETLDLYQVECIAASRIGNGIWLYDQELFQLVKIDQRLEKIIETGNLKQILGLENLEPTRMIEHSGFLYLECKNNGILVFDIYGTYYKTIPILNIDTWNIRGNRIYYATETTIEMYDLLSFEVTVLEKNIHPTSVWIDSNSIYYCENGLIKNSKLTTKQ